MLTDFAENMDGACEKGRHSTEVPFFNFCGERMCFHVLDAVYMYLLIAVSQCEDGRFAGHYDLEPCEHGYMGAADAMDMFCDEWNEGNAENAGDGNYPNIFWRDRRGKEHFQKSVPPEPRYGKTYFTFGWKPKWTADRAIRGTVRFSKALLIGRKRHDDTMIRREMDSEIREYLKAEG